MTLALDARAIRIVGSLIEKELATPDYYPLSLPALQAACNQKTSRDPVSEYSAEEIEATAGELIGQGLVRERRPAGSRVSKYGHRLGDSLGLSFGFSRAQLAVLAVLMLRGAQTAAEIRARGERLRDPQDERAIESILQSLIEHDKGPWVRELAREPGRREARWIHLLGVELEDAAAGNPARSEHAPGEAEAPSPETVEHVLDDTAPGTELPRAMEELMRRVAELETRLGTLEAREKDRENDPDGGFS